VTDEGSGDGEVGAVDIAERVNREAQPDHDPAGCQNVSPSAVDVGFEESLRGLRRKGNGFLMFR
jgi:hypothetical protein